MRDLMQNRVAHFINAIEKREMPRKGDSAIRVIALSKPPASVVELKSPVRQSVLLDEFAREISGFVEVHRKAGDW